MVITDADFDGDNTIWNFENSNLTANQSFKDVSLFAMTLYMGLTVILVKANINPCIP